MSATVTTPPVEDATPHTAPGSPKRLPLPADTVAGMRRRRQRTPPLNVDVVTSVLKSLTDKWRCVGNDVLLIPQIVLSRLNNESSSDAKRLRAAVHYWLLRDPLASWRKLLHTLDYWRGPDAYHVVAAEIHSYVENQSDPTLTCRNLSAILEGLSVEDMQAILNTPAAKSRKLREHDGSQCRTALVKYYLKTHPRASWKDIAGKCLYYGHDSVLHATKRWIKHDKDSTLTLSSLVELLKDVDWFHLHQRLDIPRSVFYPFLAKDKETKTKVCCDWYLNNHPAPSWEHVASVLYDNMYHDILLTLRDQVPSLKGAGDGLDPENTSDDDFMYKDITISIRPKGLCFQIGDSLEGPTVKRITDPLYSRGISEGDIICEVEDKDVRQYSSLEVTTILEELESATILVARPSPDMLNLEKAIKEGRHNDVSTILEAGTIGVNSCCFKPSSVLGGVFSPLMLACEFGQLDIARLLVEKFKADVNKMNEVGLSALMVASFSGRYKVVEFLMEKANVNLQTHTGWCALMYACRGGHFQVAELLLQKGASIDLQNERSWSALMMACERNVTKLIKLLLERNADVNLQKDDKGFALKIASQRGNHEAVKLLLDKNAQVDLQNINGWTALMSASNEGHSKVVRLLLEKSASVDVQDNKGYTALMYASEEDHSTVAQQLTDHGANVDLQSDRGDTALSLALVQRHADVVLVVNSAIQKDEASQSEEDIVMDEAPFSNEISVPLSLEALSLIKWKDGNGKTHNFHLMTRTCKNWKKIGIRLKYRMATLDAVKRERGADEMCWWQVMEDWLVSGGSTSYPATWEGLYRLLFDAETPASVLASFKRAVSQQVIQPGCTHPDIKEKDVERPLYTYDKQQFLYRDNKPRRPPKKGTDEFQTLKQFVEGVQYIIQVVDDNEYQAAVSQLKPPDSTFSRAVVFPSAGTVVGMFAEKKTALIYTGAGSDSSDYVQDAITTFPNAQYVIGVGHCFAFGKQHKLGDVLVSRQICNLKNSRFKCNQFIDRGQRVDVVKELFSLFCQNLEHEEDFKVSDKERCSEVAAGQFASLPAIVEEEKIRDDIHQSLPEAIGGDMESGSLLDFRMKRRIEGVAVIKGVSHYADGQSGEEWQFTASLAALSYAESKLYYAPQCETDSNKNLTPVSSPGLHTETVIERIQPAAPPINESGLCCY